MLARELTQAVPRYPARATARVHTPLSLRLVMDSWQQASHTGHGPPLVAPAGMVD
jgi:hypothetical protein